MIDKTWRYKPTYAGKRKVPAPLVGAELERMAEQGSLTAERVVESARPTDAVLHPEFEWDDAVAAEAHRRHQARTMIRAIEVVHAATPDTPQKIEPAYIHVPPKQITKSGEYIAPTRLVQAPDELQRALHEALRRLESAEAAVHYLRQLAEGRGEDITAIVASIHEGYHIVRMGLEMLKSA
jgi:hypothetical protein